MKDWQAGRTPPGVRELKLHDCSHIYMIDGCRTPPGVRELKRPIGKDLLQLTVAPLPGCVN